MTKKNSGNVREGDIKEHNPQRKRRINDIRQEEAQQELEEFQRQRAQAMMEYDEYLRGKYGD